MGIFGRRVRFFGRRRHYDKHLVQPLMGVQFLLGELFEKQVETLVETIGITGSSTVLELATKLNNCITVPLPSSTSSLSLSLPLAMPLPSSSLSLAVLSSTDLSLVSVFRV